MDLDETLSQIRAQIAALRAAARRHEAEAVRIRALADELETRAHAVAHIISAQGSHPPSDMSTAAVEPAGQPRRGRHPHFDSAFHAALRAHGLSIRALAPRVGLNSRTLAAYACGRNRMPDNVRTRIAAELPEVPPETWDQIFERRRLG